MSPLLENITELEAIEKLKFVWPKIEQITAAMGFESLIYTLANHDNSRFYYYDGTGLPRYGEAGFYDPFLDYCCHSYEATFTGSEFLLDYPYLDEQATRYIRDAGANGFKSGIGIPIRLAGSNRYGGFNLGTALTRTAFLSQFEPKLDSIRLLCVLAQRHIEHLMDEEGILCVPKDRESIKPDRKHLKILTNRERQILSNISKGNTRAECAHEFSLSESTVSTHIKNIYRKLGVRNLAEAARYETLNTHSESF